VRRITSPSERGHEAARGLPGSPPSATTGSPVAARLHLVPRVGPRPSPAVCHGHPRARSPDPLPAARRLRLGSWRRLGPLRRAAHGGTRCLHRPRGRDGLPVVPGPAGGPDRGGHRHAPGAPGADDIGVLGDLGDVAGRTWDAAMAVCARWRSGPSSPTTWPSPRSTVTSGLPGQAISYKVGERVWLEHAPRCPAPARRRLRPEGVARPRPGPRAHGPRPDPPGRWRPSPTDRRPADARAVVGDRPPYMTEQLYAARVME
jgi:hypothetical protein